MKKVFIVLFVMQMLSIVSCCEQEVQITGSGGLLAYNFEMRSTKIDTINNAFILQDYFEIEYVSNFIENPFTNSLMATSCEDTYINGLVFESVVISLNDTFEYNGETIPANTNLLGLEGVELTPFEGAISISFSDLFVNNADFKTQNYIFTLDFSTDDSLDISTGVELYMNI